MSKWDVFWQFGLFHIISLLLSKSTSNTDTDNTNKVNIMILNRCNENEYINRLTNKWKTREKLKTFFMIVDVLVTIGIVAVITLFILKILDLLATWAILLVAIECLVYLIMALKNPWSFDDSFLNKLMFQMLSPLPQT